MPDRRTVVAPAREIVLGGGHTHGFAQHKPTG